MRRSLKYFLIAAALIATTYVGCDAMDDSFYMKLTADVVIDGAANTLATTIKCTPIWSAAFGRDARVDRTSMSRVLPDGRGLIVRFGPPCGILADDGHWKEQPVDVFLFDDVSNPTFVKAYLDARQRRSDQSAPWVKQISVERGYEAEWRTWADDEFGVLDRAYRDFVSTYFSSKKANISYHQPIVFLGLAAIDVPTNKWEKLPFIRRKNMIAEIMTFSSKYTPAEFRAISGVSEPAADHRAWRETDRVYGVDITGRGQIDVTRLRKGEIHMLRKTTILPQPYSDKYKIVYQSAVSDGVVSSSSFLYVSDKDQLLDLRFIRFLFRPIQAFTDTVFPGEDR